MQSFRASVYKLVLRARTVYALGVGHPYSTQGGSYRKVGIVVALPKGMFQEINAGTRSHSSILYILAFCASEYHEGQEVGQHAH